MDRSETFCDACEPAPGWSLFYTAALQIEKHVLMPDTAKGQVLSW